ncbi:unnamed protein product [Larinioides sclopetarius]|uniref:Uncharacterized protein n=1 Tax=Larinioides sclopetarius TaxID=280406 RepID=A0AAV2A2Y4_9ARAC
MVAPNNVSEVFEMPLLNVRRERFYLYSAILVLKSHFFITYMEDRRQQLYGLTTLLAILVHLFLRTQIEQGFTAVLLETLILDLPIHIQPNISKIIHYVFICLQYTIFEILIDLIVIFKILRDSFFSLYSYLISLHYLLIYSDL